MRLPHLYLIIPIFNEVDNIPDLIRDLNDMGRKIKEEFDCRIVLVDDSSRDGSAAVAAEENGGLPLTVLSNPRNLGPGACFARGFAHLKDLLEPADLVVTMEGDNTSSTATLRHMLVRIKEGYEVVLASPYAYNGGFTEVSFPRLFISHLANGLVKLYLGIRGINTFSSFFRLYDEKVLRRLYGRFGPDIIECAGFECMVELIYKLVQVKASISEVEMKVDWSKRKGKSKMKLMKTAVGYIGICLKKNKWKIHEKA